MHLLHDVRLVLEAISLSLHAMQRRSTPDALAPEIEDAHHLLETGRALLDEALVSRTLRPIGPYIDLNLVLDHKILHPLKHTANNFSQDIPFALRLERSRLDAALEGDVGSGSELVRGSRP